VRQAAIDTRASRIRIVFITSPACADLGRIILNETPAPSEYEKRCGHSDLDTLPIKESVGQVAFTGSDESKQIDNNRNPYEDADYVCRYYHYVADSEPVHWFDLTSFPLGAQLPNCYLDEFGNRSTGSLFDLSQPRPSISAESDRFRARLRGAIRNYNCHVNNEYHTARQACKLLSYNHWELRC
jgi:hypothetical protein